MQNEHAALAHRLQNAQSSTLFSSNKRAIVYGRTVDAYRSFLRLLVHTLPCLPLSQSVLRHIPSSSCGKRITNTAPPMQLAQHITTFEFTTFSSQHHPTHTHITPPTFPFVFTCIFFLYIYLHPIFDTLLRMEHARQSRICRMHSYQIYMLTTTSLHARIHNLPTDPESHASPPSTHAAFRHPRRTAYLSFPFSPVHSYILLHIPRKT